MNDEIRLWSVMAQRRQIEKKIAAADCDLEAAERRHTDVVVPLNAE